MEQWELQKANVLNGSVTSLIDGINFGRISNQFYISLKLSRIFIFYVISISNLTIKYLTYAEL